MTFHVFGLNHESAPVRVREAFALSEAQQRRLELRRSNPLKRWKLSTVDLEAQQRQHGPEAGDRAQRGAQRHPRSIAPVTSSSTVTFLISTACISRSEALPCIPPMLGWWIITRPLGQIKRRPFSPAESKMEPMEAARPMQIVETGEEISFMAS